MNSRERILCQTGERLLARSPAPKNCDYIADAIWQFIRCAQKMSDAFNRAHHQETAENCLKAWQSLGVFADMYTLPDVCQDRGLANIEFIREGAGGVPWKIPKDIFWRDIQLTLAVMTRILPVNFEGLLFAAEQLAMPTGCVQQLLQATESMLEQPASRALLGDEQEQERRIDALNLVCATLAPDSALGD